MPTDRSGFAVATAVFALVVVGALAMGTLFAGTHELRSGSEAIHQARAVMAAELGIEQTIATWDRQWNGRIARGFGRRSTLSTADGAVVTVHVTRLMDELFLVTSEARAGAARRRVSRVVRLDSTDPPLVATLTSSGPVQVDATAMIDGSDRAPPGWDCPPAGAPLPPFAVTDTAELLHFGHFDWAQLVSSANAHSSDRVLGAGPRSTDEECDTTDPHNWGEPWRSNGGACTSYYPVIHAASDLVIDGGRGQGLLIVEGDLMLRGGFEFVGAVVVRGTVLSGPGGARITGVIAMATQGTTEPVLDGITLGFSRCAARKAVLGLASPVPLEERSWYEAFEHD